MGNDGEIDVGFGLDTSPAGAELSKLKGQLDAVTTNLLHAQKIIETRTTKMVADLNAAMGKIDAGAANYNKRIQSLESNVGRSLGSASRGTLFGQQRNAASRAVIAEARNTADQVAATVTNAMVTAFSQRLKSMNSAVEARLRKELASVDTMIANSSPQVLAASKVFADRRRRNLVNDANDPSLLEAQDQARAMRNARVIEQANDVEYANAKLRLEEARRTAAIAKANGLNAPSIVTEADLAKQKMADRRTAGIIAVAQDDEFLSAEERLAAARRQATIAKANALNNPAVLTEAELARQKLADRRTADVIAKAQDDELLAAEERLKAAARSRTINRANAIGTPAPGKAPTDPLARFNSNGGANVLAIQTHLLAGYASLSLAFNTIRGLGSFVVELDKELRNFQAVTATTDSEMDGLRTRFIETAEASHFSAVEIAKAAVTLGQAGLSAKEVADSIGAISQLATASGSDLASAVDVVTSSMSIFDMQAGQAVQIANTLTSALNLSKLTIDKVALGLQYSGAIAAQSGVSFQELVATLAALSNSGIRSGSTLGTGLRQLLIELQAPSAKLIKTLKELNLSQQDIDITSRGLVPVINTLRDAGFGASEAFGSLETRAASTFLSLSENTGLAVKLQEEFLLSNAATKANDIQMKSLANTYQRFSSVMGTVASTAMQPFVDLLQRVLSASADVLEKLNDYPVALQAIGIGIAALSTALVVRMLAPLARMVPLLFGLGGALGTVEGAVGGLGTTLLGLGKFSGPLILLTGALTALSLAWDVFGPKTVSAADRVDALQGEVNQLAGQADTAREKIDSINGAIQDLAAQKAELDKDPLMKNAKILELTSQFEGLAEHVNLTSTSVEDLIKSLNDLGQLQLKGLSADLDASIKADDTLISAKKTLLSEQRDNAAGTLYSGPISTDAGALGATPDYIAGEFADAFGQKFADYAKLALDKNAAFPTDSIQAGIIGNNITSKQKELENQQLQLSLKQKGGTLTAADGEALSRIPGQLEMLSALHDALQPMIDTTQGISQTEFDKSTKVAQKLQADIQSSGTYQTLQGRARDLFTGLNDAYNAIGKNSKGKSVDQLLSEYSGLKSNFDQQFGSLNSDATSFVGDYAKSAGVDPKDVRGVVDSLGTPLAGLKAKIQSKLDDEEKLVSKLVEERVNDQLDTLDKQISSVGSNTKYAPTTGAVDELEDYVRKLFDQKRALIKQVYDAKLGAAEDESQRTDIEREAREKQKQSIIDEQSAIANLFDRGFEIRTNMLKDQQAATNEAISANQTKLTELLAAIRRTKPGAALDALITRWNDINTAMQQDQQQSNAQGFQLYGRDNGMTVTAGGADRAAQAMNYFVGQGLPQVGAAGLVGRLLVESGLHPGMTGDGGQATGIAQWHQDRFSKFSGDPSSLQDQLAFVMQELRSSEGGAFKKLQAATTPYEAATAAMAFERPRGYTAANPEAGLGFSDTLRNATGLSQGTYGTTAAAGQKAAADLATAVFDQTTKAVKTAANQNVSAATQRIQTLVTQSKGLSDPKTVQSLIDSVNGEYKTIIDAKTKAFEADNAVALSQGDDDTKAQRDQMLEGLHADQGQKISELLDQLWSATDKKIQQGVDEAQAKLDAAQLPQNAGKFTTTQINDLQTGVSTAQQAADAARLVAAKQLAAQVDQQLAEAEATYGKNSSEANFWINEQSAALDRVTELQRNKNALDQATAQQGPSVAEAINSATTEWLKQQGVLDQLGKMVPMAQQVGQVWGQVLDGISNATSSLFTNLVSGTMTASDAFKKWGSDIIQTLIQVIAKALATQVIMAALGIGDAPTGGSGTSSSGGTGWLSDLLGNLFASPAKGSALGELVPGVGFRDGVPRKVMPGEMILRQSAVSAIGADTLTSLNNLGNRQISNGINTVPANQNGAPAVTNVYVVTPDQVPAAMGPNDVVAHVAANISQRGSLKQLIKQVVNGTI